MAFIGVRRVRCTQPIQLGSSPFLPALKTSRACALLPAIKAPRVEVSPDRWAKKASTPRVESATSMNGIAEPPISSTS
jgi:hypothetical protein